MYLAHLTVQGFRLFGEPLELPLTSGLNVLVGENDSGKTAVVDAIRLALGTTSQDFLRVDDADFHVAAGVRATEFTIRCKFTGLDQQTGGALLPHLTYEQGQVNLYLTFRATRNDHLPRRQRISVTVRSGRDGNGPTLDNQERALLYATYLRPLRDAERELDAGRNSRLSQILQYTKELLEHRGEIFDARAFVDAVKGVRSTEFPKHIVNIARLHDHLIQEHDGINRARHRLNSTYLSKLNLGDDVLESRIAVSHTATDDHYLRNILEKLELKLVTSVDLDDDITHGLGYNNLLFMACELLLLGQERDTLPLLLIEEPEAHIHPQLQLRLVEFLQEQASSEYIERVQVLITTHSPHLASKVKLGNLILASKGQSFPMGSEYTLLSNTDYRFLERFLDVTKANLFFTRGVLIVEGDAENILIPTIARLIDRDLTKYGVSIVNVGSRALRRYARIFRRRPTSDTAPPMIPIRVACLADRDILPDCARPVPGAGRATRSGARYESDLNARDHERLLQSLSQDDGENVRTFVSDHWTLEYDLAHAGLGRHLWTAIALAKLESRQDDGVAKASQTSPSDIVQGAIDAWNQLEAHEPAGADRSDRLAFRAYEPLEKGVSKAMVAQHLASLLEEEFSPERVACAPVRLRHLLPQYILNAILYVTGADADASLVDAGFTQSAQGADVDAGR